MAEMGGERRDSFRKEPVGLRTFATGNRTGQMAEGIWAAEWCVKLSSCATVQLAPVSIAYWRRLWPNDKKARKYEDSRSSYVSTAYGSDRDLFDC